MFDESSAINLCGKLGAVFATADYVQGGADIANLTVLEHMLVKGMLIYSGGSALGKPYIHIGGVCVKDNQNNTSLCQIFGKRIAQKALELFN